MTGTTCLNCDTTNAPENKFCSQCGQKMNIHRISMHEITHDAVHYFTHADKGIFYLIGKLAAKPGVVAREYLQGKRTRYFKPLNFFLLVAALVVFMTSTMSVTTPGGRRPPASRQMTNLNLEQIAAIQERRAKVEKITSKYSNIINMLATPLFAFFAFLFYLRRQYSFMEHLVANMYFVGFIMIFYSLIVVPLTYFFPRYSLFLIGIFFIFEISYRTIAYYQFLNQKGAKFVFKALAVSILASALWIFLSTTLFTIYIQTGFGGLLK